MLRSSLYWPEKFGYQCINFLGMSQGERRTDVRDWDGGLAVTVLECSYRRDACLRVGMMSPGLRGAGRLKARVLATALRWGVAPSYRPRMDGGAII